MRIRNKKGGTARIIVEKVAPYTFLYTVISLTQWCFYFRCFYFIHRTKRRQSADKTITLYMFFFGLVHAYLQTYHAKCWRWMIREGTKKYENRKKQGKNVFFGVLTTYPKTCKKKRIILNKKHPKGVPYKSSNMKTSNKTGNMYWWIFETSPL